MTENYLSEFEGKSYVSLDYHKKKLKEQSQENRYHYNKLLDEIKTLKQKLKELKKEYKY